MNLRTVRVIPFDIGFSLSTDDIARLKSTIDSLPHSSCKQNFSKDGFEYIYEIQIFSDLRLLIYADGVGEFIFYEENIEFDTADKLDVSNILYLRKQAHKAFLTHNHARSDVINRYLNAFRSLKKESHRRITSLSTWENQGLSYVMTLFLFDFEYSTLSAEQKVKIYNLLYTDNFNELSKMTTSVQKEFMTEINTSVDVLKSTHVISSWASYIVFSNNIAEMLDGILKFEIDIQHIWMYAYITEKSVDDMFSKLNTRNTHPNHVNQLYQELSTMKLCIYKYDGVISSTMHEREHRIYQNLIQTSKLDILIQTILKKYEMLDSRMNWVINERRFSNSKRTELFVFIFTILQLFTIIQDFKMSFFSDYWYFFIGIVIITAFLFVRRK